MTQSKPLPDLQSIRHVHVIGVCGTLMGAFAAFLKRSGKRVTGSDQGIYPPMSDVLREAGVELLDSYSAENLSKLGGRPDLVVIGNVIRRIGYRRLLAFNALVTAGYLFTCSRWF